MERVERLLGMTNYIKAKAALDAIVADLVDAQGERDQLYGAVKAIHSAALDSDPHAALDQVRELTTQTLKAWDARREAGR